jgi:hypothetical protein
MTDVLGDDTEFTELVDANVPRVDLVGMPANGAPGFLLMKQDSQAGLMDPAFVRDLIAKADPTPSTEDKVTMSGSPAAIARLIHEAAARQVAKAAVEPTYEQLVKAKYNADDLRRMAANGQAMDDESYPVADREDLDRAIRAVGRGGADHNAIRRHVIARAKALGASSEIPDNWNADGSLKGDVAKEMDMDDVLDPMTALAETDGDHQGMDTDPGSPAWEAVDAATARKWTSILARAKAAIDMLADRELLEAAAGDEDDAMKAFDLQDACCAIDYAISVLAPFAVAEQAEADCGEEMQAVGKALGGFDLAPLDTIEALAHIAKAGRVLSAANEAAIRGAVESLQKVLTSLPTAPIEKEAAQPVTDDKETSMPEPTTSAETTAAHGEEPEMGIAKADGEKTPMVVVYDQKGRLIGIVDPGDVTPVANAEADADDMDDAPAGTDGTDDGAPETTDLTPQPQAEAGTPADAVPDGVTKQQYDTNSDVLKSSILNVVTTALDEYSATQREEFAKQADAIVELADLVATLKGQVKALEEQPAEPKVFTNGAVPPAHQMRGQDRGATPVDVAKARELKTELYRGQDAGTQNRAALELQGLAIAQLQEIHQRR